MWHPCRMNASWMHHLILIERTPWSERITTRFPQMKFLRTGCMIAVPTVSQFQRFNTSSSDPISNVWIIIPFAQSLQRLSAVRYKNSLRTKSFFFFPSTTFFTFFTIHTKIFLYIPCYFFSTTLLRTMAFVSSFAGPTSVSLSSFRPTVSRARVGVAAPRVAKWRMEDVSDKVVDKVERKEQAVTPSVEANRSSKSSSLSNGPQGFTPYAERINGRAAQIGFFSALVIEIVTGKSIVDQILFILSPITNIFK